MIKRIFCLAVLCGLFFIHLSVSRAQSGSTLSPFEGFFLKAKGAPTLYVFHDGKKWKLADRFTQKEFGVSTDTTLVLPRKRLEAIPDGEVITLTAPRILGMYDMHEHFQAKGKMQLYFDAAKRLGVAKTLFVPTGQGPDNAGFRENMAGLLKLKKQYPERIIAFCTVDEAFPEAPALFEDCLDNGGEGLKLMVGHPNFYDVPVDSEIMQELFTIARDRNVPVLVHISIINIPDAEAQFKNLLNQFSQVRVQFAHYCSAVMQGVQLERCAQFLDAYPNLYIDLSMGGGIGRYFSYMTDPAGLAEMKEFILKYQERIFYGTDMILSRSKNSNDVAWIRGRMMCDLSLHQEKWYRCPTANDGQYGILPGFELPDEVLRKIYVENPKRFLATQP